MPSNKKEKDTQNFEEQVQKDLRFLPKASWDTISQQQRKMYLAHTREVKNRFDVAKTQNSHPKPLPSQYGNVDLPYA